MHPETAATQRPHSRASRPARENRVAEAPSSGRHKKRNKKTSRYDEEKNSNLTHSIIYFALVTITQQMPFPPPTPRPVGAQLLSDTWFPPVRDSGRTEGSDHGYPLCFRRRLASARGRSIPTDKKSPLELLPPSLRQLKTK